MWGLLDLLVLNETEAALLCGFAVEDIVAAARAAETLHRRGPQHVILTMGAEGVVVCDAKRCRHFAALKVNAVDTTAAGDTFIGTLCAALSRGENLDAGIALGIQAATLCVTRIGAQTAIPYRNELLALASVDCPVVIR